MKKVSQKVRASWLDVLLDEPGAAPHRLAALGYGAGGRIVLELAGSGAPFEAVAAVHPGLPENGFDLRGVLLMCTGSEDPICRPDQLLTYGQASHDIGVDWRALILGGAKHAFWAQPRNADGSPTGGTAHLQATVPGIGYYAAHTERAWRAVLDLFAETIGTPR